MSAANTFTVKIKTMTGEDILIPNMTMDSTVERLKVRVYANYKYHTGHDVNPGDVRLLYRTPGTDQFIELVSGDLMEYDGIIDFRNDNTELDMLLHPIETYHFSADKLAELVEPEEYKVVVPENAIPVHELSSDLNFKKIYIVNQPEDKEKGLCCAVKYISVNGPVKKTVLDVHRPDEPDIRLFHSTEGNISSTLLHDYVQQGRVLVEEPPHVAVEEPVHGGRKKRTRRTRRRLFKKRTHRKRRNHKRMSR